MNNEQHLIQLRNIMELKGNSKGSISYYHTTMKQFFTFYNRAADEITTQDIREYLLYHINQGYAPGTVNSKHSILVVFFKEVMEKPEIMAPIPYLKLPKKLPVILTRDEVQKIFDYAPNLKARAILMIIYSSGLRLSEATHLKIPDIDSTRMQVFVRQGKGKKDRYTILSEKALICLRQYYLMYKPSDWLFYPLRHKKYPVSNRSIQEYFGLSSAAAGITKKVSVHSLRHAFASHMLENETDLFSIMTLLGHSSLRTTQIYLQLSPAKVHQAISPLDLEVLE